MNHFVILTSFSVANKPYCVYPVKLKKKLKPKLLFLLMFSLMIITLMFIDSILPVTAVC